jgi:hypothetical protein
MTTLEMLATWRFRMEDPDGDKWDTDSLPRVYEIFTDAQRMGVNLLIDVEKFEHLRELQDTASLDLSGGSATLPSLYFNKMWLQDNSGDFVDLRDNPPRVVNNNTFFLREDSKTAYGYIHGTKLYLKGYDANSGSWTLGYIQKPVDIDASNDPALSKHANNLTIAISEFIGWGIDRQFDRQKEVDQTILKIFGVRVNNGV